MLYLFFVAFHFDDNHRYWWLYYGWLAIAGVVVSVMAVIEKVEGRTEKEARERKAGMLELAQLWPVAPFKPHSAPRLPQTPPASS
jgi:hypothetical protein